jgi:hypothetical protein
MPATGKVRRDEATPARLVFNASKIVLALAAIAIQLARTPARSSPACAAKLHRSRNQAQPEPAWQTFQQLFAMVNQTPADLGIRRGSQPLIDLLECHNSIQMRMNRRLSWRYIIDIKSNTLQPF